jgi:hypothetical protein
MSISVKVLNFSRRLLDMGGGEINDSHLYKPLLLHSFIIGIII